VVTNRVQRSEKRRGRPANADSTETRARVVEAARESFAVRGFDGTAIGFVARAAGMVPSAMYHYFPDKESLYEAVFAATASDMWNLLDASVRQEQTAGGALRALVVAADEAADQLPFYGRFLAAVPTEAARTSVFAGLLDQRNDLQRHTFRFIAELGRRTGEFGEPPPGIDLAEELRVLVVGWLTERRQRPSPQRFPDVTGLLALLRLDVPARGRYPDPPSRVGAPADGVAPARRRGRAELTSEEGR
jgi:AcrR family transcriptional regulator